MAKNYLPYARVLSATLRRFHPELDLFVALVDDPEGRVDSEGEPFRLLSLADLAVPRLKQFLFRSTREEAVVATKVHLLSHLLDRGAATAVFLDADIVVLADLSPFLAEARRHAVTLVPHLLSPLEGSDAAQRELNILQSGVYNGGVIAVSETDEGRRFLSWWRDRQWGHCRHRIGEGMHYDQRWLDLAPAYFEDVHFVRDRGLNVAHWNLPERLVHQEGGPWRLFHFSGFQPERPAVVTRHSSRLAMTDLGETALLFDNYRRALEREGSAEASSWPWAYEHWDNGVAIPQLARDLFRELGERVEIFGDPFATAAAGSWWRWLTEPLGEGAVSRLWLAVHDRRPDLRAAFPAPLGADREAFRAWTASSGVRELGVSPALLPR